MSEPSDQPAPRRTEPTQKPAWMPLPPSRRAPQRSGRGSMALVMVAAVIVLVLAFVAARYQRQVSASGPGAAEKRRLAPSAVVDDSAPSTAPDAGTGDR